MWSEWKVLPGDPNAGFLSLWDLGHSPSFPEHQFPELENGVYQTTLRVLSWAPMVLIAFTNGESSPALPNPGPGISLDLLDSGHWGQRVWLAAAPRHWEWEHPISVGEDAELGALQLCPFPTVWSWDSHPPLLSLTFLSQEIRTVTPPPGGWWGDARWSRIST